MSDEKRIGDNGPAGDEERVRAALRAAGVPEADPEFRARLREEFASGTIGEREERARAGAAERGAAREAGPAAWPRIAGRWWGRWLATPRLWIPTTAAAAAALALAVGIGNQGPAWRVASVSGSGTAVLDGTPVPLEEVAELRRRITPGVELQVPQGAQVNLVSGRQIAVLVTEGTELTVPPPPARWLGRSSELYVRRGILRITTGPAFRGARFTVHTPEAMAEVTGTTLAVICDPEIGTCVCVHEGTVRVGTKDGRDMVAIPAGQRRIVYSYDRPPVVRPIRKSEHAFLTQYEREMQELMGGGPGAQHH